jgi:hypothetical protein
MRTHCIASTITKFESSGFLPLGSPEIPVYAAPFDNEEALHHRIVDACQTIFVYPGMCERMLRSMMRRVEVCIESHEVHFDYLL